MGHMTTPAPISLPQHGLNLDFVPTPNLGPCASNLTSCVPVSRCVTVPQSLSGSLRGFSELTPVQLVEQCSVHSLPGSARGNNQVILFPDTPSLQICPFCVYVAVYVLYVHMQFPVIHFHFFLNMLCVLFLTLLSLATL